MAEGTISLERVVAAMGVRDFPAALAELNPLLTLHPGVGRLWSVRAQIALAQEDPAAARRFALYGVANQDRMLALELLATACARSGEAGAAYEASVVRAELAGAEMAAAMQAGNYGWQAGLADEAVAWFTEAAARNPDHPDPWTNLGFVLKSGGDFVGALAAYEEGVRRAPTDADLRWNRSQCLLAAGRYAEGLQEAEWRWKKAVFPSKPRGFKQPLWMGGYVATLLIHAEQGFGDCLQMLRYVPLAAERVGRVVLEIQPELYRLAMAQRSGLLAGKIEIVKQPCPAFPPFDAHLPMMTLPLALGLVDLGHPPRTAAHLTSEPGVAFADAGAPGRALKVGICWRGRPTFPHNQSRSFTLADMAPLFALPGVRWLSLQKNGALEVEEELRGVGVAVEDWGNRAQDFLETAGYLRSLDLCITTDTAVAHLAGALGVETWLAVMAIPDWRWVAGGEQCVWYESVRLFRQERRGDWGPVFAAMAESLATRLAEHRLQAAVVCKKSGDAAGAARYYREVLALKPGLWEIWNNLGMVCQMVGEEEEALAAYRRALHLQPGYVPSLNNLGTILIKKGCPEQAAPYLQKALALNPDYIPSLNNFGRVLLELGSPAQAVSYLQKVVQIDSGFADAYRNLGVAYQALGKVALAEENFRRLIALEPDCTEAYRNLAWLRKFRVRDGEVAAMEQLVADPSLTSEQRLHLCFALGKVYEDLGEYSRSFPWVLEGNRLKRATYEYALGEDEAFFARIKEVFSGQFLAARQGWSLSEARPIFIVGMPRSGTSLVEQILASHTQVFGAGELMDLAVVTAACCLERGAAPYPEGVTTWQAEDWQRVSGQYWGRVRQRSAGEARFTDKLPDNFLRVGLIKLLFPQAKVIHCRRDPLDTCLSIFKNYFSGVQRFAYDLEELGGYYRLYEDLLAHWRQLLPGFMFELHYEELVAAPEEEIRRLLLYCGLEWEEGCRGFHKNPRAVGTASGMQVRRPLYKDSVGLSGRYGEMLAPLIQALARPQPRS